MIKVVNIKEFIGHRQAIYSLALGNNPSTFFSGGADGMLVKWDFETTEGALVAQHNNAIYVVSVLDNYIFTGTNNGELNVFDANNHQLVKKLKWRNSAIFDVQLFNGYYYIAAESGFLTIIDSKFNLIDEIKLSDKSLRQLLTTENYLIVVGSEPALWKISRQNKVLSKEINFNESLFSVLFHSQTQTIITGGRGAILYFLDGEIVSNEIDNQIKAHLLHIHSLALHDNQSYFLSSSMDKTIKLWDFNERKLLKVIDNEKNNGHTSSVNKILWFDRNRFISCSDDRTIKCFEIIQQ